MLYGHFKKKKCGIYLRKIFLKLWVYFPNNYKDEWISKICQIQTIWIFFKWTQADGRLPMVVLSSTANIPHSVLLQFFCGNLKCEHTTYTVYILKKWYVHKLGRTSLFDIAFFVRCKYGATLLHPTLLRPFELLRCPELVMNSLSGRELNKVNKE